MKLPATLVPLYRQMTIILQMGGALTIVLGTLLPWVMPVWPMPLPVSGLLIGAVPVFVCAVFILGYYLWKRSLLPPILTFVLTILMVIVTLKRVHEMPHHILRWLQNLQIKLFSINKLLGTFQLPEIQVTDGQSLPALGIGLSFTLIGLALVLTGVLLQTFEGGLFSRGLVMGFLGRGACRGCGTHWALQRSVNFCPQCGVSISGALVCKCCGNQALPNDHYCCQCGESFKEETT